MDAISPATRERGFSDTFAARPCVFNERDGVRHGSNPAGLENRSPSDVPKGLENMLKTTTETGDIGMFSIKPSRVPQSLNTPRRMGTGVDELGTQKTRQAFQPHGVPVVDDRRRLPSYSRDTSSEVISMYETASQKSASRAFEDPDYRSYSMTQTSYSSYTLSNHRSYASLRSQPDGIGLVQRPKSPFAYPTRLKRPGFRPSSPALTDGGAMDYTRRVEIDRAYGRGQNTSSPSSLYARKRKPPLSMRPDANKSTISLLSQSSPPRRSSSPLIPRHNGYPANDLQRKNGLTSEDTSPAHSTLSLASTVNLYVTTPVPSATTTPGKLHPPSPLYYDYTEDFEVEVCVKQVVSGPPPSFGIEKTIPEDRPMSADRPPMEGSSNRLLDDGRSSSMIAALSFQSAITDAQSPEIHGSDSLRQDAEHLPQNGNEGSKMVASESSEADDNKKVILLSGLGDGARALSFHAEELFGLPSSPSFVIDVRKTEKDEKQPEKGHIEDGTEEELVPDKEPHSVRTSSHSFGSQFPQFPFPPGAEETQSSSKDTHGEPTKDQTKTSAAIQNGRQSLEIMSKVNEDVQLPKSSNEDPCISPSERTIARFSGFNSINAGLTELAELIEITNKPQVFVGKDQGSMPVARTSMTSPAIPDKSILRIAPEEEPGAPLLSSFRSQRGKELQMLAQRQPAKRNDHRVRGVELSAVTSQDLRDVPNFSHQIPQKAVARSESPMLAPKPISPARQLKLKNSIPQLMKALPPLPPEPPQTLDPPTHAESRVESPRQVATLVPDLRTKASAETPKGRRKLPPLSENYTEVPVGSASSMKSNGTKETTTDKNMCPNPAPKLKLKLKSSGALRPTSPLIPQPLNLEERYPWSNQNPNIRLQSTLPSEKPGISKQPRFKLRVTRASDSTQGTVRVMRTSEDTDSPNGLDLSNPKDLFTPSPRIDNIFRQFSRHLHSRKTSANSTYKGEDSEPIFTAVQASSHINESPKENAPALQALPSSATSTGVLEARSVFSDDSSQVQGNHSLRKRISNLRARIGAPYTTKTGAQSYDDITWRDRHGIEVFSPITNRSDSNLRESNRSPDIKPMRRLFEKLHRQKLKAKVQSWLKGARSLISGRVKPKHSRAGGGHADKIK